MPKNKTEWMFARAVTVKGTANPGRMTDEDGETNSVAALMIQRTSGVGTLIIEGRPEELTALAEQILETAMAIETATNLSPALKSLYGRFD